jgi:hypothetical protein
MSFDCIFVMRFDIAALASGVAVVGFSEGHLLFNGTFVIIFITVVVYAMLHVFVVCVCMCVLYVCSVCYHGVIQVSDFEGGGTEERCLPLDPLDSTDLFDIHFV